MTRKAAARQLRGRRAECAVLDRLVADVRSSHGQAVLVHGEAGIGKSALLHYVGRRSTGCRVVRAAGVESEMQLPFAGLHQLCAPLLDLRERLPPPQSEALGVAFGFSAGTTPDRFLVGVAVLSLLAAASEEQPVLCLIDDAQWLDQTSAQTLAFVSRRLLAERVGVVLAMRDPVSGAPWRGLPDLTVGGLSDDDARALLDSVVVGRLDEQVRDRIVAEARGNPLALLELPRGLTTAELAGGFGRPDAQPLTSEIERSFARRVRTLPEPTRKLLLTAAAEPLGNATLLRRAAILLELPTSAAAPAEAAGLIELGLRVQFRHPLVRTAVYRAASPQERRVAHRALAEATDPDADPDRRAWHRAFAADDADEEVAAELISSAERAQRRGGLAAAAEFLRRATELTPDPDTRAVRALAAAEAALGSGAFEFASKLLTIADEGRPGELHQARVNLLRARTAFESGHDSAAPRLLLAAARRLEPLDVALARDTYREAMNAAVIAGGFAEGSVREVAQAILDAPRPERERPGDRLLDSVAVAHTDGYQAAAPLVSEALRAFRDEPESRAEDQPWLFLAVVTAADRWDESWMSLAARHVRVARSLGDFTSLPMTLNTLVVAHLFAGERAAATSALAEVQVIGEAIGVELAPYGALVLAAWHGDEATARPLHEAGVADAVARGEDTGVIVANWTAAILYNGLARYEDATSAAQAATRYPAENAIVNWARAELVEAATRSGRPELATDAYEKISVVARASGTDWALGTLARCGALLANDREADTLYKKAIEHLGRTRVRVELARTNLLYGEWLRREGHRREARRRLRLAYDLLTAAGVDAFAERARRELAATGETVGGRPARPSDSLTAQEAHIARLAGGGLTNAEIGAQLYLSPHTVEWHLRKVFAKLGISSRRQLRSLHSEA